MPIFNLPLKEKTSGTVIHGGLPTPYRKNGGEKWTGGEASKKTAGEKTVDPAIITTAPERTTDYEHLRIGYLFNRPPRRVWPSNCKGHQAVLPFSATLSDVRLLFLGSLVLRESIISSAISTHSSALSVRPTSPHFSPRQTICLQIITPFPSFRKIFI